MDDKKLDAEMMQMLDDADAATHRLHGELSRLVVQMFYDTFRERDTMPTIATEETLLDKPEDGGKAYRVGEDTYAVSRGLTPQFTFDTAEMRVWPGKLRELLKACVRDYADDVYRRHMNNEIHVATPPKLWLEKRADMLSGYAWGYAGTLLPRPTPKCHDGSDCDGDACEAASICIDPAAPGADHSAAWVAGAPQPEKGVQA